MRAHHVFDTLVGMYLLVSVNAVNPTNATCVPKCTTPFCGPHAVTVLGRIAISLARIFGIVLLGYITTKIGVFQPKMKPGVVALVTKFTLPATVFFYVADIDLSTIELSVVLAVVVGKLVIFLLAFAFGYALRNHQHGASDQGRDTSSGPLTAGAIFGLFCTVSGDPAYGGQFMYALYPDFGTQIILFYAISFIVCCPLGFTALEIDRAMAELGGEQPTASKRRMIVLNAIKNTAINPNVSSAVIAIVFNLIFGRLSSSGPGYAFFFSFAKAMSGAFPFPVLFMLGVNGYGKLGNFKGRLAAHVIVLSVIKTVLSPVLLSQLLVAFTDGDVPSGPAQGGWLGLLFLYGTFPTAPVIPMWALQFKAEVLLIAVAMVVVFVWAGAMTFIGTALVVSPSDSHETWIAPLCGAFALFTAVYFLLPVALNAASRQFGSIKEEPFHAYWLSLIALACVGLGSSWVGCDVTDHSWWSQFAVQEFFWVVLRLFTLGAMHELLNMAMYRNAASSRASRARVTALALLLAFLLVALPSIVQPDGEMYNGKFPFAHCSLIGASDTHKWISFVVNFAFVVIYVYQTAALEREHSREHIPKRVDKLWAGTTMLGGADSNGDVLTPGEGRRFQIGEASTMGSNAAAADVGAVMTSAQRTNGEAPMSQGMSDKFKWELAGGLLAACSVLRMWEVLELLEVSDLPPSTANLVFVLEMILRTIAIVGFLVCFGSGNNMWGRFSHSAFSVLSSVLVCFGSERVGGGEGDDENENQQRGAQIEMGGVSVK